MTKTSYLRNKNTWFFLGIIVFGFLLRAHNLTKNDFWYDEVCTFYRITSKGFDFELLYKYLDKHPPFYFYLLKQYSYIFGINDFSLRFFSVIFGLLSIPLLYKIGTLLFNKGCGLLSATFLSFSAFHLWYAQEARMFSLSTFLILSNLFFFIKILKSNNKKYWLGYFFSLLACILTTYFTLIFLISQAIVLLFIKEYRLLFKQWFLRTSFVLIIFVILYPYFFYQLISICQNRDIWLIPAPKSLSNILFTLENFILGYNGTASTYALILGLLSILTVYTLLRLANKEKLLLFVFLFFPLILIFFVSRYIFPLYADKQLIIFSPFLYLIISQGIISMRSKGIKILFICLFLSTMGISIFNYYNQIASSKHMYPGVYLKRPIRPVVKFFLENKKDDDIIGCSSIGIYALFKYYLFQLARDDYYNKPYFFFLIPGIDPLSEKKLNLMNRKAINPLGGDLKKYARGRLWFFASKLSSSDRLTPNSFAVKSYLDGHFPKERGLSIEGAYISIYNLESIK